MPTSTIQAAGNPHFGQELDRARSTLGNRDEAALCGLGAAWLMTEGRVNLPTPAPISTPHHHAGQARRQLQLEVGDTVIHRGLLCTSPVRTACDILRSEERITAIGSVDAMMNRGLSVRDEIAEGLSRFKGRPGYPKAVARLAETEPNAASFSETRLRLDLIAWGLPRPVSQLIMLSPCGEFGGRADLGYEELRLAVEYLGRIHEETIDDDWDRLAGARACDYECVGITASTLRTPGAAARRVREGARRQQQLLGVLGEFPVL